MEGGGFQLGADALGEQRSARGVGLFAHHHELFAAEAADGVGVALHAPEHVGKALDHQIADVVTVGVVDAS